MDLSHNSSNIGQQVKASVDKYIKESWLSVAEDGKSLGVLNMESCNVGKVHPCWSTVDHRRQRAVVKARILTGTYHLQTGTSSGTTSNIHSVLLLLKTGSIFLPHACRSAMSGSHTL